AMSLGKTVLVAEAGRSGVVAQEEVQLLVDGLLNVMGALHMIDRSVHPVEHPVWLDASTRLTADAAVMFFATVARGNYVAGGAKIGTTTDFLGRAVRTLRPPVAGVVPFTRGVPPAAKGPPLATIGRVLPEPPPYRKPPPPP